MVFNHPPKKIDKNHSFYSKSLLHSIGIEGETVDKLIYIIKEDDRYKDYKISDEHIIWVFLYWKQYLSIEQVCITLGITSRTFHNYYSKTLDVLYHSCKKVLEERYDWLVEELSDFISHPLTKEEYRTIAADSKSINIQKPTNYTTQKLYYHGKEKKHQMKFHVEIETRTKKLLLVSKGYQGTMFDNKIADDIYIEKDENNLPKYYLNTSHPIRKHDKYPILGDKGYIGLENFITPFKTKKKDRKNEKVPDDVLIHNSFVSSHRIYVENFFLKPKNDFNVLGTTYRGDLNDLEKIVLVIFFACDLENDIKLESTEYFEFIQEFDPIKLDGIRENRVIALPNKKKKKFFQLNSTF